MADLEERLERIEAKLDKLLGDTEVSTEECKKMGDHIDWVENIFYSLRNPLRVIFGKPLPKKLTMN